MDIIGRHLLTDFYQLHPESKSALRGVSAIVAAAVWQGADDVRSHLGMTATATDKGRVSVADPDHRFRLILRVNYPRQLVHILAVEEGVK